MTDESKAGNDASKRMCPTCGRRFAGAMFCPFDGTGLKKALGNLRIAKTEPLSWSRLRQHYRPAARLKLMYL
jgi:hypothetical protein